MPSLLNERELSEAIGVSLRTVRSWRVMGRGPVFCKLGSGPASVRYRREDVDQWLAECRRSSTSDTGSGAGCGCACDRR